MLNKIAEIFFLHRATTTAWATHKNSETKSKFHVPRYMEFCFFFKPMYPGTWYYVFSSIYVPGYMEFWYFFKSMYPGTWNLDFVSLLMCSSGGGGGPVQKIFFLFAKFFQHMKKLFNFWNFVKIKMAKFKLNHLG